MADLLPALAHEDVQLTLLTPRLTGGEPVEQPAPAVHVIRVPTAHTQIGSFPDYVAAVNEDLVQAALHLEQSFDMIHTHDWMTAHAAIALQQRWNTPLVATIHATERGRGRGHLRSEQAFQIDGIERWLTHTAQRLIVCSQHMAAEVTACFGIRAEQIDVIPNAVYVQPNPFTSDTERLEFRRRYAADDERLAFFIGRVVDEKGVHILIDAWAQVVQQVAARLVLAGHGPLFENCKAHAAHLGLESRISFPGRITDEERSQFYRAADVAVFPSIYEPFGIVALEAQAAQCPVVVSATGGLQEIVRPHETGILVQPASVESLVWGLLHTLQHPHWAHARAHNAQRDLEMIYNWGHVARQTIATFQHAREMWQQRTLQTAA
ncbi:MAG: glycosyltransferase family 4 protein [Chloroflexaceae bacterium]|nr:glycosyltransferase family 4 protein [Chloroflexaceae bacterium]NJO05498.1 glycosyltransferase family 4 protein [Chloroflexaceae bacterium]